MRSSNPTRLLFKRLLTSALALSGMPFFSGCLQPGGFNLVGSNEYGVPVDRMPPPGLCRAWFPNRPVEQQPPIADCSYLERRLPPGAQLIRGGSVPGAYAAPAPGAITESTLPSARPGSQRPDAYGAPSGGPANGWDGQGGSRGLDSRRWEDVNRRY